jgi:RNA binding exosome subunit
MIKYIHSIQINVFEKNEQNIKKIKDVYQKLLPIDFIKENFVIQHEELEGFNKKSIHSLIIRTKKNRHNTILINSILNSLSKKDLIDIFKQMETRLDDEGNFYIRLDKKTLFNDHFNLVDHGDCFHIKIKILGYPANKKNYIESSKNLLQSYIDSK